MKRQRRALNAGVAYYYGAAIMGLIVAVFGILDAATSAIQIVSPESSADWSYEADPYLEEGDDPPTQREIERLERWADRLIRAQGVSGAIIGGVMLLVGLSIFTFHLVSARRRERDLLSLEASATEVVNEATESLQTPSREG